MPRLLTPEIAERLQTKGSVRGVPLTPSQQDLFTRIREGEQVPRVVSGRRPAALKKQRRPSDILAGR